MHKFEEFFWQNTGEGAAALHEPEGAPYIFYEHIMKMRLSTADCICISWLLGAKPPDSHRGSVPGPHWRTSVPRLPVPTLSPNPGYATATACHCCVVWVSVLWRETVTESCIPLPATLAGFCPGLEKTKVKKVFRF